MRKTLLAAALLTLPIHASAQGVSEGSIISAETDVRSVEGAVNAGEVAALVDGSAGTADQIRMLVDTSTVTLVKLGERRNAVTGEIEEVLNAADTRLADLRNAIQINAVITEVLNQHTVGLAEVIGVNVTDNDDVVVYAFAAHGDS